MKQEFIEIFNIYEIRWITRNIFCYGIDPIKFDFEVKKWFLGILFLFYF